MKDLQAGARPDFLTFFIIAAHSAFKVKNEKDANVLHMQRQCIKLASASLLLLCSLCALLPGLTRTSSFSGYRYMRRSTLSRARRNCTGPLRFSVRAEARGYPIGGYCNSCSFARWPSWLDKLTSRSGSCEWNTHWDVWAYFHVPSHPSPSPRERGEILTGVAEQ